jgi:hypothetical protein
VLLAGVTAAGVWAAAVTYYDQTYTASGTDTSGVLTLVSPAITTTGTGANGAFSTASGSSLTLSNVTIKAAADGVITSNAAIVPAGTNGSISAYVTHATDLKAARATVILVSKSASWSPRFAGSPCGEVETF